MFCSDNPLWQFVQKKKIVQKLAGFRTNIAISGYFCGPDAGTNTMNLRDNNFYHEVDIYDDKIYVEITWGDWKHDHGWCDYLIEDFFKSAKGAFGLGKFHSYTTKSMSKNIYLTLLLTALVVQCGFKTKTQLQQLAEGKIEFQSPKKKNTKNKKNPKETKEKFKTPSETGQQELEIEEKQTCTTLDLF